MMIDGASKQCSRVIIGCLVVSSLKAHQDGIAKLDVCLCRAQSDGPATSVGPANTMPVSILSRHDRGQGPIRPGPSLVALKSLLVG